MGLFSVLNNTKVVWIDTDTDYFWCIVVPLASFIGLVANVVCFTIFNSSEFINKIKLKENLYRYLKIEALFIILNLFIQMFRSFMFVSSFQLGLLSKIYALYMLWILAGMLEMSALLAHLTSTADFYMIITNRIGHFKWLHKISKFVKALIIFVISFLTFSYLIFCFNINGYEVELKNEFNETITDRIYAIEETEFKKSSAKTTIEIIAFVSRDGFINLVLTCLNVAIFLNVKNSLNNKKKVLYMANTADMSVAETNCDIAKKPASNSDEKIKKANIKAVLMVILTCLNNIFGRTPILIVFILRNFYNLEILNNTINKIACLCVYISYIMNFFIYYFSNSRFRKILKRHFFLFITCKWIEKFRK
jgi:hypothetical protein